MQTKLVIFPADEGLNVVVWGKWTRGSMRVRYFATRTSMISVLENLCLITSKEARDLESFTFIDTCPLFSAEIEEELLASNGFRSA
jgi:hypothetical protein